MNPSESSGSAGLLRQAADLLKQGNKADARKLLAEFLKREPRNADAWYLASFTFDDMDKRIQALQRALEMEPMHERARRALGKLRPDTILEHMLQTPVPPARAEASGRPKRTLTIGLLVLALAIVLALGYLFTRTRAGQSMLISIGLLPSPTATMTETPTMTATITPSATFTLTPTPSATETPVPSPTPNVPTATRTPTASHTPYVTYTPQIQRGDRDLPVRIGESLALVRGGDQEFDITVGYVLRGSRVWGAIRDANMFNPEPRVGREYVLVAVVVCYSSGPSSNILRVYDDDFKIVSRNQILDEFILITGLDQFEFSPSLLPGSCDGGALVRQVHTDEPNPLLVFGMKPDGTGGFYFSLSEILPGYNPTSGTQSSG